MSPILDIEHDSVHPVEGDEAWSESWYFNCYDPLTDTGFFTRMAIRPNEGTIDVGLSVWLPREGLAARRGVAEQREMADDKLQVGGVRHERIEPMQRWRLTAADDGDGLAMDVTFDALVPAVGVDGQRAPPSASSASGITAATRASVGRGHLEQAGRWSGWIETAGERRQLGPEARGNRDKSWGPRRWGGPKMWRWFSVNVSDAVHFGGIRIGTDAGDLHRGWVWRDGAHASIRQWDVKTELEADNLTHRVVHVRATDKQDRVHELRGELLRVAMLPHGDTTLVNEGLARWEYEGRTGYGIAEYLHQLDGDGNPVIPIE